MAKENKTMYAILGMLSHEPMTGYDIKKNIERTISYFWEVSFGQIYPALKALHAAGLVEKKVAIEEGRPVRKVYTLTASGREELKKWLSVPAAEETLKYEILLKLFFGSLVPLENTLNNIQAFKERNKTHLRILEQYEQQLRAVLDENEDHRYYLATVLFGKRVYRAYLDWTDEVTALLKQSQQPTPKKRER